MSDKPVLYGFNGSTYVRSVRHVMHAKGVEYDQVMVNVLAGEPRGQEHLKRHPFGKVPVLDVDGLRLLETHAINRYLDETREGPSFMPASAADRARMTQAICLIDSYGYDALVGTAGYHLFPDFLDNPSELQHRATQERAHRLLNLLMDKKGESDWLAGDRVSLADIHLAPLLWYIAQTPEKDAFITGPVADWYGRIAEDETFRGTAPDL